MFPVIVQIVLEMCPYKSLKRETTKLPALDTWQFHELQISVFISGFCMGEGGGGKCQVPKFKRGGASIK